MGLTKIRTAVRSLSGRKKPFQADFLVDTGAIDCMAPGSKLKAAGIKPEGTSMYELADGTVVEYQYGFGRIAFMGTETVAPLIFGPENTGSILGVVALENTGISLDPRTRKLMKMPSKPLKKI